jgi:hypothetical protein
VIFFIGSEENSTFWTIFHALIIEAAVMASSSYSFTEVSTGSQIKLTAQLAARIDKRKPALQGEGGRAGLYGSSSHPYPRLYNTLAHADRKRGQRTDIYRRDDPL